MTFRQLPIAVTAAVLALAAIPAAQADTLGGVPVGVTSNSLAATNVAAGKGNVANQSVFAQQFGQSPLMHMPQRSPQVGGGFNSTAATNLAAGEHNRASQGVATTQLGGGTPWSALGGSSLGSNSVNANNIAAGFGNKANQMVGVLQGPGGFNRVDANNIAAGFGNSANQQIMATQR